MRDTTALEDQLASFALDIDLHGGDPSLRKALMEASAQIAVLNIRLDIAKSLHPESYTVPVGIGAPTDHSPKESK